AARAGSSAAAKITFGRHSRSGIGRDSRGADLLWLRGNLQFGAAKRRRCAWQPQSGSDCTIEGQRCRNGKSRLLVATAVGASAQKAEDAGGSLDSDLGRVATRGLDGFAGEIAEDCDRPQLDSPLVLFAQLFILDKFNSQVPSPRSARSGFASSSDARWLTQD